MARDDAHAKYLYRAVVYYRYQGRLEDGTVGPKIGSVAFGPYPLEKTARGVGTTKAQWYRTAGRLVGEPIIQRSEMSWESC